jgi:hypothetical protein
VAALLLFPRRTVPTLRSPGFETIRAVGGSWYAIMRSDFPEQHHHPPLAQLYPDRPLGSNPRAREFGFPLLRLLQGSPVHGTGPGSQWTPKRPPPQLGVANSTIDSTLHLASAFFAPTRRLFGAFRFVNVVYTSTLQALLLSVFGPHCRIGQHLDEQSAHHGACLKTHLLGCHGVVPIAQRHAAF